jgi:murein DD-endopeptidase MepM/ murein hydrolase activator NlpD
MYPVSKPRITSAYGKERTLPNGVKDVHRGVDLVSDDNNTNLYAVCDGIVVDDKDNYNHANRWNLKGKDTVGNRFVQKSVINAKTYYISYYHTATNCVSVGDVLKKGQVVGVYGDVGYSFGAHVHVIAWDEHWNIVDPSFVFSL